MEKETALVRKARRGDASAFAALYQEYYQDLYRFALYTLKNRHDAEDMVGDTVADAWAQMSGLKNAESFKSWIFRILSNKCRMRLKDYLNKTEEIPEDLKAAGRDVGMGGRTLVEPYEHDVGIGSYALPRSVHKGVGAGGNGRHMRAVGVDGGVGLCCTPDREAAEVCRAAIDAALDRTSIR